MLINALSKFTEIEKAVIFGLRVKGNYKEGSDIDVAIYFLPACRKTVKCYKLNFEG